MALVKVRQKAQITLPLKVREALGIEEGDYLEVTVEGSRIVLTPKVLLTKLPPVRLLEQGERMLREALADVAEGRVKEHDSVDSLIEDLQREAHQD
ncbi:MAG: AbrB/MazE/SpoVT family DNA-binding domain-containing protein [Armatimonadota bacterium]